MLPPCLPPSPTCHHHPSPCEMNSELKQKGRPPSPSQSSWDGHGPHLTAKESGSQGHGAYQRQLHRGHRRWGQRRGRLTPELSS